MALKGPDTTLGGGRKDFPETHGDFLLRLRRDGPDELARRYWKPIYYYFRVAWAKSNDDAKDLTQAFLAWVVESDALRRYDQEKAGFRTFLKTLLKRFAQHDDEARKRLKRGGAVTFVGLEEVDSLPAPSGDPEQCFDRAWVRELTERAIQQVRTERQGDLPFRAFEEVDLVNPAQKPTYAEAAARLGLKESDVRNYLFTLREQVRASIRRELAALTRDAAELEAEWNELLGL
jgi:RNA polymerase sigma factor (sigma-70 family)